MDSGSGLPPAAVHCSGARLLSSPRHPALGGSNPEVRRVQDTSTTALSKRLLERDGVHYYPGPEAPAQSSSVTFSDNGDTITSQYHIDHHIDTIVGKGTEEDISGHLPLDLVEQPTSIVRVALFNSSSAVAEVEASSSMGPGQRRAATTDKALEAAPAGGGVMAMACEVRA